MGEAKRRKNLGLPYRKKSSEFPKLDKELIQTKVRNTLYRYPIIPFLFYGAGIFILFLGVIYVVKFYKFI